MATMTMGPKLSKVVSHSEWTEARKQFLAKEKEFTRLRDELSQQRRELPWEKIEKNYVFDGARGKETLADLFDGRSQLVVYHFMLGPGWAAGCPSCSYISDQFDGMTIHLAHRDVTLAVVSRAPYPEIDAFQKRMDWKFHWVSSSGSDFNYDYHVSATPAERATGTVDYNYTVTQFPSKSGPEPASSSKMRQVRSTTRIQLMRGDSTYWSAHTTSLTLCRRDGMKMDWRTRWRGFATTTSMTVAISSIRRRNNEEPKAAAKGSCCSGEHRG